MRTIEFKQRLAATTAPPIESARSAEDEIFVSYAELAAHGVPFTRVHLRRLASRGLFPLPIMLSANRIAWKLSDLSRWKASRPVSPITRESAPEAA
jgi:predicted DNA-binding transcriptional regulator AlpA